MPLWYPDSCSLPSMGFGLGHGRQTLLPSYKRLEENCERPWKVKHYFLVLSPLFYLVEAWDLKVVSDFPAKFPTCPERLDDIPGTLLQASERTLKRKTVAIGYLKNLLGHTVNWRGLAYAVV